MSLEQSRQDAGVFEQMQPRHGPKARRYDLVTEAEIKTLAAFHNDIYPVVSLYLDVRPEERQRDKVRAKLKHLIDEARHLPAASSTKERGRIFQQESECLMTWFETEYDYTGRGLAIFTTQEHELWSSIRLPVPTRDRLIIADRPYLRPLLTLIDEFERYMILLVDKQIARLFVVYLGEIEEYTELMDELVPHSRAGGLSAEKNQRHHEMHVLWHVKHTVEATEQLWMRERCQWLLVGGPEEALAELRSHLPKALHERLAGEIAVSLKDNHDVILARALEVEQATERHVESERVTALFDATFGTKQGVLGLDDTLEAIVEQRVWILVMEEDFREPGFECPNCQFLVTTLTAHCPLCDTQLEPQLDIVERAVERALDQKATIEVLRGDTRQALAAHGHIGAILRYAIKGQPEA